jgi:hypothetical protein
MRTAVIVSLLLFCAVYGSANAQKVSNGSDGSGAAHDVPPASAGQAMGHGAASGTAASTGQGSLMQKRESAMAPNGASSSPASGKMKQ